MKRVAEGFCRWCSIKTKKAVDAVTREILLKKIHRSLSEVIDMRDTVVRHRLELCKALEQVWRMMDNCGCGASSAENNISTMTTLPLLWAADLDKILFQEEGSTDKKEESIEIHLKQCGIQVKRMDGVVNDVVFRNTVDTFEDNTFMSSCKKCSQGGQMAQCFQTSVAEYNKTILSLDMYINECAQQMARLKASRKWGRKSRV